MCQSNSRKWKFPEYGSPSISRSTKANPGKPIVSLQQIWVANGSDCCLTEGRQKSGSISPSLFALKGPLLSQYYFWKACLIVFGVLAHGENAPLLSCHFGSSKPPHYTVRNMSKQYYEVTLCFFLNSIPIQRYFHKLSTYCPHTGARESMEGQWELLQNERNQTPAGEERKDAYLSHCCHTNRPHLCHNKMNQCHLSLVCFADTRDLFFMQHVATITHQAINGNMLLCPSAEHWCWFTDSS